MGFGGVYGPDGKIVFALAYARSDERPEAECAANAHLIAAAPDLLATAKAVIAQWESPAWAQGVSTASIIATALRDAVNKAEGKQ